MKNYLFLLLFGAFLALLGCSERTYFNNAGMIYNSISSQPAATPKLKWASEGFYRFDICAHDTLSYNTNIQWFCDCSDPKSEGSVDSFAMAFVDEIRVVFFKRPKDQRQINLAKPGKETKIGIYSWEFKYFNGSARAQPRLVVRINSPKSNNKENDFSDLFFELKGEALELVEMKYFDDDSSITDMTRRKKRSKGSGPMVEDPKEGMRTIRPREVFAVTEMVYQFVPQPIVLKYNDKEVQKIEYRSVQNQDFIRNTLMKNGDQLRENSVSPDSIKTW